MINKNARIIVTGGVGFIGSNIVDALNRLGFENIILVDRLGTGEKWRNLQGLIFSEFIDKDDFLKKLRHENLPRADVVFHMGACSATTERDADYLMRNNYQYSRILCDWALSHQSRFIVASSAATYGDGDQGYDDDDGRTPGLKPLNMYGMSKQLFDLHALRNGLYKEIVGLKFFNVFGPREAHKGDMRSMVHKAYYQVKEDGRVRLFKSDRPEFPDGGQKRDFVYVKDVVEMMLWFMDNPQTNGLFNAGTGKARSWIDLANAVFKAMKTDPVIEMIEMPGMLKGKYQYFTQAKMEKLRNAGYTNEPTSLEDAVADYVSWLDAGNP